MTDDETECGGHDYSGEQALIELLHCPSKVKPYSHGITSAVLLWATLSQLKSGEVEKTAYLAFADLWPLAHSAFQNSTLTTAEIAANPATRPLLIFMLEALSKFSLAISTLDEPHSTHAIRDALATAFAITEDKRGRTGRIPPSKRVKVIQAFSEAYDEAKLKGSTDREALLIGRDSAFKTYYGSERNTETSSRQMKVLRQLLADAGVSV